MSHEIAATDALLAAMARSEDARNAQTAEIARPRLAIERALTLLPGRPAAAAPARSRPLEEYT